MPAASPWPLPAGATQWDGLELLPASCITPTAPRAPLQTVLMLLNCSFRPQRTSSHKSLVGSISFMEEYLSLIPCYKVGFGLEFRHTPDMDVPPHAVEQALHQPGTDPAACMASAQGARANWLSWAATTKQMGGAGRAPHTAQRCSCSPFSLLSLFHFPFLPGSRK